MRKCNAALMLVLLSAQNYNITWPLRFDRSHIIVIIVILHLLHRFFNET